MDSGKWHFPLIDPERSWPLQHYIDKVSEELMEFQSATSSDEKDKEVVDVLHAAETLVRKYFAGRTADYDRIREKIIIKNTARGYYHGGYPGGG
jgi:hypothetical protein